MEFVGRSFSGVLKTIAIIIGVVVFGYLFIHAIPLLLVAAAGIYGFLKFKNYIRSKSAIKNAKVRKNVMQENDSKTYEDLDSDIIDVDYREV